MARHGARLSRLERATGIQAERPEAMLNLGLTEEPRAATAEAEKALDALLLLFTQADKAGTLWDARGNNEKGVSAIREARGDDWLRPWCKLDALLEHDRARRERISRVPC